MSLLRTLPLLALLAAAGAQAQTTLKPGLWELASTVKSQSGTVEKAMAEAQAQIARLPAEQRRQIEQMMAERGVGIDQGRPTVRLCLTAADLADGNVPVQSGDCSQTVLTRDGDTRQVTFTCRTEPPASGEGQIRLLSPTALRATSVVNTTVNGQPERLDTTQDGRWLGESCGSIPPLQR